MHGAAGASAGAETCAKLRAQIALLGKIMIFRVFQIHLGETYPGPAGTLGDIQAVTQHNYYYDDKPARR